MGESEELARTIEAGIERGWLDYCEIERLLHEGADPNVALWGAGLLHALAAHAAEHAAVVARVLLGFGASVDGLDREGATPLCVASRSGNAMIARELLRRGANPSAVDLLGEDAMLVALERVDEEMVSMLLAAGRPVRGCKDRQGRPALVCVADHPRASGVAFEFLHRGADPEERDEDGWTPLAMAARSGNASMVSLLISEGASPLTPGPGGYTPFASALGARFPDRSKSRVGPGHMACAIRLARHFQPGWGTQLDAGGWPALGRLYRSIGRCEKAWMDQLVGVGADPKAESEGGWSLLRLAAEVGDEGAGWELALWALARGVNPSRACARGVLPEQAAWSTGRMALGSLLSSVRERGALGAMLGPAEGSSGGSKRL